MLRLRIVSSIMRRAAATGYSAAIAMAGTGAIYSGHGGSAPARPAIVNGYIASSASFDGVVALKRRGGPVFCSGEYISDRVLITSGHCVYYNIGSERIDIARATAEFFVMEGIGLDTGRDLSIDSVIHHPKWDGRGDSSEGLRHDIALVVTSDKHVGGFYAVDNRAQMGGRAFGMVVGYGRPSIDQPEGIRRYSNAILDLSGEDFVQHEGSGRGCEGDSGGGVFTIGERRMILSGISQRGTTGCNGGSADFAVRVAPHEGWINEVMLREVGAGIPPDGGILFDGQELQLILPYLVSY